MRPTAIILFSHGSLLCGSGQMVAAHAARLRSVFGFVHVAVGYLNYCKPSIEEAVADCIAHGAERIIVSPYFLVSGKFVTVDLPARMEKVTTQYPRVEFVMAQALGETPAMDDAVQSLLRGSTPVRQWQEQALDAAKLRCEKREDCPLYGTPMCRVSTPEGNGAEKGSVVEHYQPYADHLPINSRGFNVAPVRQDTSVEELPRRKYKSGVLMVLHGSPRPEANRPARHIATQLRCSGNFDYAEVAYLECNEPAIPDALAAADASKVSHLRVVPYFLHLGRHQVIDVPDLLAEADTQYPDMEVTLCNPVGTSPILAQALLRRIDEVMD